jgi:hypothetical protein
MNQLKKLFPFLQNTENDWAPKFLLALRSENENRELKRKFNISDDGKSADEDEDEDDDGSGNIFDDNENNEDNNDNDNYNTMDIDEENIYGDPFPRNTTPDTRSRLSPTQRDEPYSGRRSNVMVSGGLGLASNVISSQFPIPIEEVSDEDERDNWDNENAMVNVCLHFLISSFPLPLIPLDTRPRLIPFKRVLIP